MLNPSSYRLSMYCQRVHILVLEAAQDSTAVHDGEDCAAGEAGSNAGQHVVVDEGLGQDGHLDQRRVQLRVV